MNRLVIIGNGFDMAHGLKTSYKDFINWYWDKRIDAFVGNTTKVSTDCLCKLTIITNRLIIIFSRLMTDQANPLTISRYDEGRWVCCSQIVPREYGFCYT